MFNKIERPSLILLVNLVQERILKYHRLRGEVAVLEYFKCDVGKDEVLEISLEKKIFSIIFKDNFAIS